MQPELNFSIQKKSTQTEINRYLKSGTNFPYSQVKSKSPEKCKLPENLFKSNLLGN